MTEKKKINIENISGLTKKDNIPSFSAGDTLKVHCKIREGSKERIQIFEGVVIKLTKSKSADATFTVRKVSYDIGVERTFFLNSPSIDKIELMSKGRVRRARLFYLRSLRGKAARIETEAYTGSKKPTAPTTKKDTKAEDLERVSA